jgi:hypothetical protein
MIIEVNERDFNDIWQGRLSLPDPPDCKLGDELVFQINDQPAARAVVSRIEKFEGYRVYWHPHTFTEIES